VVLRRAEVHRARAPAVDVGVVGPERGYLEARAVLDDQHDAELDADWDRAAEEAADHLGRRARGDVVVLRLAAEEPGAGAASGEVRLVAGGAQAPHEVSCDAPPLRHRDT